MQESNFGLRHATAKGFIRALLNPDPSRRLTAEQALTHSWVTSFAAPTEHDLSGLRENFDSRARWRNAISAARVLSRFGNHKGANNHKDKSVVSSDDEDDDGGGGSTSRRATPKQTITDRNNSCRRRRRTIVYRGAGWRDSWRRGQQGNEDHASATAASPVPNVIFGCYQEG